MTTQFPLSGPMSVGDLLDRAFRLYRARFGLFLLTSALFLLPAGVIFPFVIAGDISDYAVLPVGIALHSFFLPGVVALAVQGQGLAEYFTILMLMLTNGSVTLVLTVQSIETLHRRPLSAAGSIRACLRRFLPYAGMSILKWGTVFVGISLATILGMIGMFPVGAAMRGLLNVHPAITDNLPEVVLDILLSFIGFLPFIPPLFLSAYLLSYWLAAPAVLVAEGLGPVDVLVRCWRLSRGSFLRVISFAFLLSALVLLINFPLMTLANEITSALLPVSYQGHPTDSYGVVVGSILASVIIAPFYANTAVLLYYDLSVRSGGNDPALGIAEPEEQAARPAGEDAA